jgi:hypothetical protein
MWPSSSDRSTLPSDCANSALRNLASKNGLSSARMNLRGVHQRLKHARVHQLSFRMTPGHTPVHRDPAGTALHMAQV